MKKNFLLLIILLCLNNAALFGQNSKSKKTTSDTRIIKVDYNNEKGILNTMFKECIGAGRANEGLRADWQQQLAMVKKDCDFKYIQFMTVIIRQHIFFKK